MTDKRKAKSAGRDARKSPIANDDARLWEEVMASTEPLRKKKPVRRQAAGGATARELPGDHPRRPAKDQRPGPAARSASAQDGTHSLQSRFNRRQLRQIASGREDIEARLDLHGMRQRQAHQALRAFLLRAQGEGKRMVLVITGKGPAGQDSEIRPFGGPERGVLKRLVPKWLAETELGALVAGYSTAKARHGGAGALYVRLRRARRVKE